MNAFECFDRHQPLFAEARGDIDPELVGGHRRDGFFFAFMMLGSVA